MILGWLALPRLLRNVSHGRKGTRGSRYARATYDFGDRLPSEGVLSLGLKPLLASVGICLSSDRSLVNVEVEGASGG